MSITAIKMAPRDLLFFRDGRPMAGSNEGAGAVWPLPSVLHSALLSALHRRWPERQEWEISHTRLTEKEINKIKRGGSSSMRFGSLRTWGPFPLKEGEVYLPTPADLGPNGALLSPIKPLSGTASNLPAPLKYTVASPEPPIKEEAGPWISLWNLKRYLKGNCGSQHDKLSTKEEELYIKESRPGVGIDRHTRANLEGIFYQAEYLRLKKDVSLLGWADAALSPDAGGDADLIRKTLPDRGTGIPLLLGGQGGSVEGSRNYEPPGLFEIEFSSRVNNSQTTRVKWILLSPAFFPGIQANPDKGVKAHPGGWIPNWIDAETGDVMLPEEKPERGEGEKRSDWRERIIKQESIKSLLVAACIPTARVYSGWKNSVEEPQIARDERGSIRLQNGPRPTRLLVPAGSIYYFECDTPDAAAQLVKRLHLQTLSGAWGEQGFGFGVCAEWNFLKE